LSVWLERRSAILDKQNRGFNYTRDDSQYQRDRARIIHSASFRSLQSKTQVLGLGESDFYRTRLTHEQEIPSFSLIEAICLAHDIGHSPFGHGGEVAMNTMMKDDGGFEANGQTLRILARLGEYSPECGLDLTRRSMLGTIKYPVCYSQAVRYPSDSAANPLQPHLNIDQWAPPKCIYDDEADVLAWLLEPFSQSDQDTFLTLRTPKKGHLRTQHKPFDTSIMEFLIPALWNWRMILPMAYTTLKTHSP